MIANPMKADAAVFIHRITTAQFIRAIMREVRHVRQREYRTMYDAADISGHNYVYISLWERGVRVPSLFEALNLLQAVRCA